MNEKLQSGDAPLQCEKRWVFLVLIFVAGFYGGYTLSVRGGVFCNAQTANIALFAVALAQTDWAKAAYYLIPMGAYLLGIMVAEAVPKPLRKTRLIRWDTMLMIVEILVVITVGLIPADAPHQICQVIINFTCAMQFNTFRQAEGISMATTFCTNHVRMFGSNLTRVLVRDPNHPDAGEKTLAHGLMLLSFAGGVLAATLLCGLLNTRAIWITLLPLVILFAHLLKADLTTEKDKLDITPKGH